MFTLFVVLFPFIVGGIVYIFLFPKGQDFRHKYLPFLNVFDKKTTIGADDEEDWDNSKSEYSTGVDLNKAQQELIDSGEFVYPTDTPDTTNANTSDYVIVANENGVVVAVPVTQSPTANQTTTTQTTPTVKPTQQVRPTKEPTPVVQPTTQVTQAPAVVTPIENRDYSNNGNNGGNSSGNTTANNSGTSTPPQVTYSFDSGLKDAAITNINNNEYSDVKNNILTLINQERAAIGVNAVSIDNTLSQMAAYRSLDMQNNNYFSHTYNGVEQINVVVAAFQPGTYCYEILAKAKTNNDLATYTVDGWHNSDGHYRAMTDAAAQKVGIAIVKDSSGYYYVSAVFSK